MSRGLRFWNLWAEMPNTLGLSELLWLMGRVWWLLMESPGSILQYEA